jgi:hypothetical protein
LNGVCGRNASTCRASGRVNACYSIARAKEAVKKALYTFWPPAGGIAVSDSTLLYVDGVFNDQPCVGIEGDIGHSVLRLE